MFETKGYNLYQRAYFVALEVACVVSELYRTLFTSLGSVSGFMD